MIKYFDNASTSYPKPKQVVDALTDYYLNCGSNVGRGCNDLAIKASSIVFETRRKVAKLFGIKNFMNVIWCFNTTDALNLAIKGSVREGWHVITSDMEHNSTIRVLKELEDRKIITLSIIDMCDLEKHICNATKLVVVNHISNVNGEEQPIAKIGSICRSRGITTIVDAAQSAGLVDINMSTLEIDMVAVAGHKALYGVQGTAILLLCDSYDYHNLLPQRQGGTGSNSENITHPKFLPDCFEAGTLNIGGIAALSASIDYINSIGVANIANHKRELARYFIENAKQQILGFRVVGETINPIGVVTFTIDGLSVSELSDYISEECGVAARGGLHCSPLAHKRFGSYPDGGLRFSFGVFNTKEEIDDTISGLKKLKLS